MIGTASQSDKTPKTTYRATYTRGQWVQAVRYIDAESREVAEQVARMHALKHQRVRVEVARDDHDVIEQ